MLSESLPSSSHWTTTVFLMCQLRFLLATLTRDDLSSKQSSSAEDAVKFTVDVLM